MRRDLRVASPGRGTWWRLRPHRARRIGGRRVTPAGLDFVRPAWALSCGWKSRRKWITTNEVKRNCVRVTKQRGKEAWSVSCEPMNKNRIEGTVEQGERALSREAVVIKARRCRSGGCAVKECVLTWGRWLTIAP